MTTNNTKPTKQRAISLRLPTGLYDRLNELAKKNRMNLHAYCIKQLWINSGWKSE